MKNRLPLIAWAALPLTVGLAFAAQPQRVQPVQPGQTQNPAQPQPGQNGQALPAPGQQQPGQRQPGPQSGTNYGDVFLQKLAAQLGLSVDKLKAAAVAAGSATIDQGVKAGDFPSDRAAEMKQRLNENPFAFGGRGPGGRGGHGMHGHGRGGPEGGLERGPRGMQDQDGDHAQGDSTDDTNAQGTAQDSSFTF